MVKRLIARTLARWINKYGNINTDYGSGEFAKLRSEFDNLRLSAKQAGLLLGRHWYKEQPRGEHALPRKNPLGWRASCQRDLETDWFRYWCNELHIAPLPHRKLWEYAWVLQNLHSAGMLEPGKRGLGFGCGEEPLPSYFAQKHLKVTATDLSPEEAKGKGWIETGQHASDIELAYKKDLVDRDTFNKHVELSFVDMNNIPDDLHGKYDFCWSICALEHLGSIENGLRFVEESMKCLAPGGVALHTTELNCVSNDETLESENLVLFRQRDLLELASRLRDTGFTVPAIDFDTGERPLDLFIDVPPYQWDIEGNYASPSGEDHVECHMKLMISKWTSTCYGICATKQKESRNSD